MDDSFGSGPADAPVGGEMKRLDRDRAATTRITTEERRMIDEAVASGRVTRVPTGASAFRQDYGWGPDRGGSMKLHPVDADPNRKPGQAWRRQISEESRLARARGRK